jgi:SAM-dependent methyltransferase
MAQDDQLRWDRQHAARYSDDRPSSFLVEILSSGDWPLSAGRALDVACGKGRNALYLAERGFRVTGMDISAVALAEVRRRAAGRALPVMVVQTDLENAHLVEAQYDLIVNFNYLQRSLIPQLHSALKPGAHIIFDSYLIEQKDIGHPKNPEYLLAHNELLRLFAGTRILYYREGRISEAGVVAFRARLLAQRVA